MATSPLFGWEEPDDVDLVKDGAAAIRTLGNAIDTSMGDLLGGTSGQVLSKNSNTNMDFTWVTPDDANAIQNAIVDAKGDLIAATAADTPARLAVGTNGQVLTADSTAATGLAWATPAATSGPAFSVFRASTNQTITTATFTKVQFNAESFDTDNCFDSTTNYRFTPTKAGYYQFNAVLYPSGATVTRSILSYYKNGSENIRVVDDQAPQAAYLSNGSTLIYLNGTTDYVEVYIYLAGTSLVLNYGSNITQFSGVWIRS